MTKKTVQLVIDARPLARNVGGMTRYIAKILPHLINCEQLVITLYTDQPIHHSHSKYFKNLKIRTVGNTLLAKLAWHLIVPVWLYQDKPDLYWSPRQHLPVLVPKSISSIVTIHDLVWKTFPNTIPVLQRLSEQIFMARSVKRANHIICISESTKTLLNKNYQHSAQKTTVIRHGLEVSEKDVITTQPKGQYLLAVGTLEPRKNYPNLIKGFEEYARIGSKKLVIVGKKGWLFDDIIQAHKNSPFKNRIDLLESVNDKQLSNLYSQAGALISPSLDEGYGLPPLEATIHGIPLLLSNIPVYKELYPYAFDFFNPTSPTEITSAMLKLDNIKQHYLVDLSKQTDWDGCAKKHINCFIDALPNQNMKT